MKNILLKNFINYVKIDTMSNEESGVTPSTEKQFVLAKLLVNELIQLGLKDIHLSENCFVYATLPANVNTTESIGFVAHMDTIPGFSGTNVNPQIIENYDGSDIHLNGVSITNSQFPFMKKLVGKTLITTDGTTVLGADDKAGIAEIMTMLWYYTTTNKPHVNIHVAFTPDEEIGSGIEHFNLEKFKCDYAFTVDGGAYDEINYENFNAASAHVIIKGLDIHPGDAKDKMRNASLVAMEFNDLLPTTRPENTSGYEGFIHLTNMNGAVGESNLYYILRDHNIIALENKKEALLKAMDVINFQYGKGTCEVTIKDSYFNMAELIKTDPRCIDKAIQAMKALNINPVTSPIRGGTDGARLTYMGLNTPNLGTGGYNCHGPYEFSCLEEMEIVTKILIEIAKC